MKQDVGVTKLVQMEIQTGILVEDLATGRFTHTMVQVPCPLQAVERGTSRCLAAVMRRQLSHFFQLDVLKGQAAGSFTMSVGDRCSANDGAFNALMLEESGSRRLRLPCFCHVASTCQSRAFKPVSGDVCKIP